MKALAYDVDTLRSLRPHDVAAYLRTRGWTLAESVPDRSSRYALGSSVTGYEVEIPLRTDFRDFHLRMGEVLSTLARAEKRSPPEILRDLSLAGADVVRLRLLGGDLRDGTVPLEDGALLVDRARDIMLASACAALARRPY